MSKTKIIGIPAWDVKTGESLGVTMPYLEWAARFGQVIMLTPGYAPDVDLLLLPGGADVDTDRYNEVPSFVTSRPNHFLEYFDRKVLPQYIERKTPIFGICRGIQTLNVALGGSLHQNLLYHPTSSSGDELDAHGIYEVTATGNKSGKKIFEVGSWHHQSCKALGKGLKVALVAEDMTVESVIHQELPIAGVQWHPERCYDEFSDILVKKLIK